MVALLSVADRATASKARQRAWLGATPRVDTVKLCLLCSKMLAATSPRK
jgi:hypothetical protein